MGEGSRSGPLTGVRVLEFASIGPGPHCGMLLSDLGAEVIRIDRPGGNGWPNAVVDRGRHVLEIDIRTDKGRNEALELCDEADVVIEGFRPGVMERLGLGPDALLARKPRLVFGRITGWGQTGPLAMAAGHDINYIALTGALAAISDGQQPIPPLNLVGDFGGGSLYLALGIAAALLERERSGMGQIVDAAIVDGTASLMAMFGGLRSSGYSLEPRGNLLGGHAPFYRCYECADGNHVAVGPLEPHFYAELLGRIGGPNEFLERQDDAATWEERTSALAAIFRQKTRDEWCALLEGTDACFAPVLTYDESLDHPQMVLRGTYVESAGVVQAAPAPRFSRTPCTISPGGSGEDARKRWLSGNRVESRDTAAP